MPVARGGGLPGAAGPQRPAPGPPDPAGAAPARWSAWAAPAAPAPGIRRPGRSAGATATLPAQLDTQFDLQFEPQFEEGSSGINDSIRYAPPLRRSTDIQSRSGSRVKTSSGRAGSTIHADSPISPSRWPGPHPE